MFLTPVHGRYARPSVFNGVSDLLEDLASIAERGGGTYQSFRLDAKEVENGFELTAELPGVKKEDIDISVDKRQLTITVEREEEKEVTEEEGRYLLRERRGFFGSRSILLPEAADEESISARLTDGILTIKVNKVPEKQSKRITIS